MREKYLGAQNLSRLILLFFYEINAKNLENTQGENKSLQMGHIHIIF